MTKEKLSISPSTVYKKPSGAFFNSVNHSDPFFKPMVQKKDDDAEKETEGTEQKEEDTDIHFGSMEVFYSIFDDLILQWPGRWKQSYERAKEEGTNTLFDPAFGKKLISDEIMSLWNILHAIRFSHDSPYESEVGFSKGLKMAEHLTGVSDTYIHLASLALHRDMEKYLSDDIPDYAKQNLGIFLISGALLQSGLVGLNALTESELDFTSLLGPATSSFTEQPVGLKRPFMLKNIPDPRWKYPFWKTPGEFALKYTGTDPEADARTLSLSLGLNIASIMDLYPKEEKDKEKYKGFELYPYFSYSHNEPIEGEPAPSEEHKFLTGFFVGDKGYYTLLEGGGRFDGNDLLEAYSRAGFMMKNFGPLSLLQATGELDYRPANETSVRGRINAATSFEFLDTETWKLKLGAAAGGLLPSGGEAGAIDVRANLGFGFKYNHPDFPDPLESSLDLSYNTGKQDPFDAASPRIHSVMGRLTLFDMVKFGLEYHKINQESDSLPNQDLRTTLSIDFAPMFTKEKKK